MQKLYKQIDGRLHYREAWAEPENRVIVEHWGLVGEKGNARSHPLSPESDEDDAIATVLQDSARDGFSSFDANEMRILLVEYSIDGMGTRADVEKRHALEDLLNETLGWTGLGHCDGGSMGSGTMEVCCSVVDFEIARELISDTLAGTRFSDYSAIYEEDV